MISQRFRIKTPTLAICERQGRRETMYVPTGDIVVVVNGPLDGTRLVDVEWNGAKVMMFTIDLRERADLIIKTAAGE